MTLPSLALEGDFNPAVHFLGLIKKAQSDGLARRCSVSNGPQIVIAPGQTAYYSASISAQDLRDLCLAQPFDLQIEPLPDWNPEATEETLQVGRMRIRAKTANPLAGLEAKPLAGLLWLAALVASNGRLLQGCRADEPVRLKQLPDFAKLPHHELHLRLAQFMHTNNADLLAVARQTGSTLAEVFNFHNACAMLGLIERGNLFDPAEHFIGLLQRSLRDGQLRRFTLPGQPPVYLAPQERRYYWPVDTLLDWEAYYTASPDELAVEAVASLEHGGEEEETIQIGRMLVRRKKESSSPKLASGPIDELLWNATLHVSRGRLLLGKRTEDIVRLKRWPDFSRLAAGRHLLPLAAFMSANATNLPGVARRTGVPLEQAVDFHNACAVLDYLEYLPEERLQQRQVSEQERKTFRSISKSLGGIRAVAHAG